MGFQIQTNLLHYYRNLLKKKDGNGTSTSLQNIVNTMKISRNGKVCGENLSYLNFGSIPLTGIDFSLEGKFPSCFDNCNISKWNFTSAGHYDSIIHAEFSEDSQFLITWGKDARIIVWKLSDLTPCIDSTFDYKYNTGSVLPEFDNNLKSYDLPQTVNEYIRSHLREHIPVNEINEQQLQLIIQQFMELVCSEETDNSASDTKIISYNDHNVIIAYNTFFYLMDIKTLGIYKCTLHDASWSSACISPDDKYFFISDEHYHIYLYSIINMKLVHIFQPIRHKIRNVTLSADLKNCISLGFVSDYFKPSSMIFWDLENECITDKPSMETITWKSDIEYCETEEWFDDEFDPHRKTTFFSPDNKNTISIFWSDWGNAFFFKLFHNNTNTEKTILAPFDIPILDGAITYDSHYFIYLTDSERLSTESREIILQHMIVHYDILNDCQSVVEIKLPENRYITCSTFSIFGDYLFLCLNDGTLNVIESKSGQIIKTLIHTHYVHVKNCRFHNITTDSETYTLLYQYGADIDASYYPETVSLKQEPVKFHVRNKKSTGIQYSFMRGDGVFSGQVQMRGKFMPEKTLKTEMEKYGLFF